MRQRVRPKAGDPITQLTIYPPRSLVEELKALPESEVMTLSLLCTIAIRTFVDELKRRHG